MKIENLTGLEKPLEKLVETTAKGVGSLADHFFHLDVKKIKRVGEAEAEIEKTKIIKRAEGQEEAVAVLERAHTRFSLEQYHKQINLENIFVKARENLEGAEVSEEPVDEDWSFKFFQIAQNISKEELQDLLAKILSEEVKEPGTFSYKTLETLKYLDKRTLQILMKWLPFSFELGIISFEPVDPREHFSKYGLRFAEYIELVDLGIFRSGDLNYDINIKSADKISFLLPQKKFYISNPTDKEKRLIMPLLDFGLVGVELRSVLLEAVSHNEKTKIYIEDFKDYIKSKGFELIDTT